MLAPAKTGVSHIRGGIVDISFDDPDKKAVAELVLSVAEKKGLCIASTRISDTITGDDCWAFVAGIKTYDVGLLSEINFDVIERMSERPDLVDASVIGYFESVSAISLS